MAILASSLAAALLAAGAAQAAPALAPPPLAPTVAVTDTVQGTVVPDPYRWLENPADPKVHAWSAAQNARARGFIDALPERTAVRTEIKRILTGSSARYAGLSAHGGQVFATFADPVKQQPMLVVLDAGADPKSQRILLDPNTMDPSGHTAIDWWVVSPDGARVAVSLSKNGSEDGVLHVYRAGDGQEEGAAIPRVQYPTAGGSLAWTADGTGFWYTRYPGAEAKEEDRHFGMQVYFHRLGTDWHADPLALGIKDGLERISEVFLDNTNARPAILASVQRGDGGKFAHYVLRQDALPVQLSDYADQVVTATIGPDDALYAVSRAGAPNGRIVKLTAPFAAGGLAHAPTIVPEGQAAIRAGLDAPPLLVTKDRLLVSDIVGGPTDVRVFDHEGHASGTIALPAVANVGAIDPMQDGSVLVRIATYLKPSRYVRWNPETNAVTATKLAQTSPADFSDAKVTRVFATSKDGTKIPLNIISRKDVRLDGHNPTILYGYGGYGISMTPTFLGAPGRVWLDAGGVYVIANIRGGAEYGERWHAAGALLNKQNVFDDFAAAASYLVSAKYTSHDRLALFGESNGGLLMGAMITQHPDIAKAVISRVGIYDMVRVELDPNGAFNTTEFGSVKDPAQFQVLYSYSPYHHVKKGTHYPAMLFTAGDNDGRVNPLHSRKFTAALQAASGSDAPILLETSATSGHGMGDPLDAVIDREADIESFATEELGAHFNQKP